METDISLSDYGIQKKNSVFGDLDEKEREERILMLLNFGFVWNPYYQEFENRFLDKTASAEIANLTPSMISDQVKLIRKKPKSFEEVKNRIYWDSSNRLLRKIDLWMATYSIIYGSLIWVLGIALTIFSDIFLLPSALLVIGTILIYYWVTYQLLYTKIGSRAEQAPLMYKNEGLFRFLRILSIGLSFYLIFTYNESPDKYMLIGLGVIFTFLANYGISKSLVSQWWCFHGFFLLEKYYSKLPTNK